MSNSVPDDVNCSHIELELHNFFQLRIKLLGVANSLVKFTLLRNRAKIHTITASNGRSSFNLESYGNYVVIAEYSEGGTTRTIESEPIKFDGFGADPNEKIGDKVAILGISRLALAVEKLLVLAADVDVTFFSINPNHIGCSFGSSVVNDFWKADLAGYGKWIVMNGLSDRVSKRMNEERIDFEGSSGIRV